jgi:hypothetical protein
MRFPFNAGVFETDQRLILRFKRYIGGKFYSPTAKLTRPFKGFLPVSAGDKHETYHHQGGGCQKNISTDHHKRHSI